MRENPCEVVDELLGRWDWLIGERIEYVLRRRDPSLDPDALESRLLEVLTTCAERHDPQRGPFEYYARRRWSAPSGALIPRRPGQAKDHGDARQIQSVHR